MINSRKKGSRNERGIVKLMLDWTGYEFARTPQSGGLHWKKKHTCGDVVCIDDVHGFKFPFSIEAKFHENLDLLHLIDDTIGKKSNKVILFWEQAEKDAKIYNRIPLLFMRRNGMKAGMHFVVMPTSFFLLWLSQLEPWACKFGVFHYTSAEHSFTIINSEDLFSTEYKIMYKMGRRVIRNVPAKV